MGWAGRMIWRMVSEGWLAGYADIIAPDFWRFLLLFHSHICVRNSSRFALCSVPARNCSCRPCPSPNGGFGYECPREVRQLLLVTNSLAAGSSNVVDAALTLF